MRMLFGAVSLLLVLAIVGVLASKQLKSASTVSVDPSASAPAVTGNVREQSQHLQEKVRDDVTRALEQGAAARKEEADK